MPWKHILLLRIINFKWNFNCFICWPLVAHSHFPFFISLVFVFTCRIRTTSRSWEENKSKGHRRASMMRSCEAGKSKWMKILFNCRTFNHESFYLFRQKRVLLLFHLPRERETLFSQFYRFFAFFQFSPLANAHETARYFSAFVASTSGKAQSRYIWIVHRFYALFYVRYMRKNDQLC